VVQALCPLPAARALCTAHLLPTTTSGAGARVNGDRGHRSGATQAEALILAFCDAYPGSVCRFRCRVFVNLESTSPAYGSVLANLDVGGRPAVVDVAAVAR
jgi:hypothetical protein